MRKGVDIERMKDGLRNPDNVEEVDSIVEIALEIERDYYAKGLQSTQPYMFRLRKALEGIWGHDLPFIYEDNNEPGTI